MRFQAAAVAVMIALAVLALPALSADEEMAAEKEIKMPFGGEADIEFAKALWAAMDGYHDWPLASDYYASNAPHGAFVKIYSSIITIEMVPYHVIVKDNFGGEGATLETVAESPGDYLAAVTVMVRREAGYDPDNHNWFWVKYGADGTVDKNDAGVALAGRVAKGMTMGCIACHGNAKDGDYYFTND
jgi:hypothetical protein